MSQTVLMGVECIGLECKACPELALDVDQYDLYDGERDSKIVNNVFCKHYRKCERIADHLRKNSNSDNEKDGV